MKNQISTFGLCIKDTVLIQLNQYSMFTSNLYFYL